MLDQQGRELSLLRTVMKLKLKTAPGFGFYPNNPPPPPPQQLLSPTEKKMVNMAIKVVVLEGDFAAISDLGFPFSLSLQLQSFGLKLSEAMWTAKSSSSGFSVSLYWPKPSQ